MLTERGHLRLLEEDSGWLLYRAGSAGWVRCRTRLLTCSSGIDMVFLDEKDVLMACYAMFLLFPEASSREKCLPVGEAGTGKIIFLSRNFEKPVKRDFCGIDLKY